MAYKNLAMKISSFYHNNLVLSKKLIVSFNSNKYFPDITKLVLKNTPTFRSGSDSGSVNFYNNGSVPVRVQGY